MKLNDHVTLTLTFNFVNGFCGTSKAKDHLGITLSVTCPFLSVYLSFHPSVTPCYCWRHMYSWNSSFGLCCPIGGIVFHKYILFSCTCMYQKLISIKRMSQTDFENHYNEMIWNTRRISFAQKVNCEVEVKGQAYCQMNRVTQKGHLGYFFIKMFIFLFSECTLL